MQHLQGRLALSRTLTADPHHGAGPIGWVGLLLLCAAYLLPGIVGHDPWKPDEGYIFGGIEEMVRNGDWIVPRVGGEPFMEKPPLFHWVAVATATASAPLLAMHDGARVASVLFMVLTLAGVAMAAQWTWGRQQVPMAILLALSCLGLPDPAHMIVPDLPQMAGSALALAGLCGHGAGRSDAGLWFGTGVGIGFVGKGLLIPGILGVAVVVLVVGFGAWRRGPILRFAGLATAAAAPWLLIWPTALYLRSPELFGQWFWDNNIGRFVGSSVAYLGAANEPGLFWRSVPWFLFPAWLYAAAALVGNGREAVRQPGVQASLVLIAVAALALSQSGSLRTVYLLPLIPAVAVLGARAALVPPAWLNLPLAAAGSLIAIAALGLFWPVWLSLLVDGRLPDWALRLQKWLPAAFAMPWQPLAAVAAAALSVWAAYSIVGALRRPAGGLRIWVTAVALAWGLLMTLWLPWLDAAKSYRDVFHALGQALPGAGACTASRSLGESERAMLDYFVGLQTRREEVTKTGDCPTLLVQSRGGTVVAVEPGWEPVWSGARPGDSNESFQLYRRTP